jgi:hypothetical protein
MEHHLALLVRILTRARQAPNAVAKLAALALVIAAGVVVRAGAACGPRAAGRAALRLYSQA